MSPMFALVFWQLPLMIWCPWVLEVGRLDAK